MERVYRDHASRVLSAAYRVTGSSQDAEDVLQTVFMRLVRRDGGAHLDENPAAYLHRAAVNAALDLIRSRKSARATPLEESVGRAERTGNGRRRAQAGLGRAARARCARH